MPVDKKNQAVDTVSHKRHGVIERFKSHDLNMNDNAIARSLKLVGVILLTLLCIFVFVKTINEVKAYNSIGEAPMSPYTITVSGKGEVEVKRDTSVLSFTARAEGKTVKDAQSKSAEINNKALAILRSYGVEDKDINTASYTTNPIYDQKIKPCEVFDADGRPIEQMTEPSMSVVAPLAPCNSYEQVIKGYEAIQVIDVKIRNIDTDPSRPGTIVGALGPTGVLIGGFVNKLDEFEVLKSEAKQKAIVNARIEAQKTARALGVRLGDIVSFYENDPISPMYDGEGMDVMSAHISAKAYITPDMPAGDTKVTSYVSVSFEIK